MSNQAKDFSEKNFQEKFVRELEKYKWVAPDELDGNKQRVTVDDLIRHWRSELNRINVDQLEGVELTDGEFAQVMTKVSQIENSYEAAKILAMESSTGKIDGIYRESNSRITKQQITLTIFKKAEVSGGDSSYKIAREVSTENNNRFDIVLLINGLPLINIEQKRTDKSLEEAFQQFKRYYSDGEYVNNFMAFSQMMVITSEIATRYFATPKSMHDFNPSFVFAWADKHNKPINRWEAVVEHFLMVPMAHQLVGDYLIIDEAKDEENRRHMIMRPYQVYALRAVEGAALGWDNEDKIPHGGYVWHTTGSGKTITSFKTALVLSTRGGFDKVVFLVDRRELDKKTSENFKAYAVYEPVSVDDTQYTSSLKKQLLNPARGIVVTTTHKLSALVKDLFERQDHSLSDKKILFIIDEAHRTTMGQMMVSIRKYFKKHGLFYGYTGTPLFDENQVAGMINDDYELIDTTEKLFGPELHSYTIDQAILDRNVLGFHVDYINTGEFVSYEQLREQLVEIISMETPEEPIRKIEKHVYGLTDLEVEEQARNRGILVYQDETHIPRVVTEILDGWEDQSQGRHFNAILTVAYKNRVIKYYKEFKKQLESSNNDLNIAMTFSFGGDESGGRIAPETIEMMFKDYAEFTGIEFVSGDPKRGEDAYFEDLVFRATRGGSDRNPKNIDLVIVADQLLTGYDSKYLNTLYVDRELRLQSLIQAYSRTNRVYGWRKEFGSIINFQYPRITEERVNTALRLYGSGGESSRVIVDEYKNAVSELGRRILVMLDSLPNPAEWEELDSDIVKKELFLSAFKDANKQLNIVSQYYEFRWNDEAFGIDEHSWLRYIGAYRNLTYKDDNSPEDESIRPLVGKTKLAGSQIIDAQHILNLIGAKVRVEKGIQTVDEETLRIIHEQIQELSDMGENEQAKLLKKFVDEELSTGNLSGELSFDESYDDWKRRKVGIEIGIFSKYWGLNEVVVRKSLEQFSLNKRVIIPFVEEIQQGVNFSEATNPDTKNQLEHVITLVNTALPEWLIDIKRKYYH